MPTLPARKSRQLLVIVSIFVSAIMTLASNEQAAIIRTERGLTIAGTRITLYDVMDYVTAQYPSKFIRALFALTDNQINAALAYIEANHLRLKQSIKWFSMKPKNFGSITKNKIVS